MQKFQIIPAIDLINGQCVRLTQGDFTQKTIYDFNPVDVAKSFADSGIRRLHLVDLDGARQRKLVNYHVLEAIVEHTNLHVDFSGGITSATDIDRIFNAGADYICVGSIASKDPATFTEWLLHYQPDRVILGADVKDNKIVISGWSEDVDTTLEQHVTRFLPHGLKWCMTTDITRDGLLQGPHFDLYKKVTSLFPEINWIASGGVSTISDIYTLKEIGVSGVIIGKALYEKRISLNDLQTFIN
jgi:phosphoribosylformimino-5-aminoimidazole carboxamide ribotide isomerase